MKALETIWVSQDEDLHLSTEEAQLLQREITKAIGSPPAGASFVFTGDALIVEYAPYDTEAVSYVLEVLNWRDNK